ncbi:MAG: hypothetical protein ACRD51_09815 [Candidatus Acidiferrum sp.]
MSDLPVIAGVQDLAAAGAHDRASNMLTGVSTVDHERIGTMHLVVSLVSFLAGNLEALLMRIQLARPENHFLSPSAYNQLFCHARYDHDFSGCHAGVDGVGELSRSTHDRGERRGAASDECFEPLAARVWRAVSVF